MICVLERNSAAVWLTRKGIEGRQENQLERYYTRLGGTLSSNCGTGEKGMNRFYMLFRNRITWTWWIFGWEKVRKEESRIPPCILACMMIKQKTIKIFKWALNWYVCRYLQDIQVERSRRQLEIRSQLMSIVNTKNTDFWN